MSEPGNPEAGKESARDKAIEQICSKNRSLNPASAEKLIDFQLGLITKDLGYGQIIAAIEDEQNLTALSTAEKQAGVQKMLEQEGNYLDRMQDTVIKFLKRLGVDDETIRELIVEHILSGLSR